MSYTGPPSTHITKNIN